MKKFKFLTLIAESWSHNQTVSFFGKTNCSEYAVRKDIKRNIRILGKLTRKPRNGLSDEVKKLVIETYEDETSRMMPSPKTV